MYGDGSVRENSQFAFARHGGETDLQGLAAQFDSNNDGVLDAKDSQFGEFAVWQDTDQDGVSDAGELKTLVDLGITALQLNSDGVQRTPETGVTEAGRTTAQLANGSTLVVADAAFNYTLTAESEVSLVAMDPGSSSGVTAEGSPASASVIPAPEPGSMPPDANTMDPGSSSGVTNAVIPASEPGSMTPVSLVLQASETTLDLTSFIAHNGNTNVTQIDLTGTGNNTVRLSLNDVLQTAETPLLIKGNDGDVVELFTQGQAPIQSTAGSYTSYDFDANGYVDLLVDQQVRVTMM
jgi:hypothetical protein